MKSLLTILKALAVMMLAGIGVGSLASGLGFNRYETHDQGIAGMGAFLLAGAVIGFRVWFGRK